MARYTTPFVWQDSKAVIDEGLVIHVGERLGIAPGLFRTWVHTMFPPGSIARAILVVRAFDNCHGTRHSEQSRWVGAVAELPDLEWDAYFDGIPDYETEVTREDIAALNRIIPDSAFIEFKTVSGPAW